jgi:hypothetical protein
MLRGGWARNELEERITKGRGRLVGTRKVYISRKRRISKDSMWNGM